MKSSVCSVVSFISQLHFLIRFNLKVSSLFLQQHTLLSALHVTVTNIFKERIDEIKDIKTNDTKGLEKYVKQHFMILIVIELVQI